MHSNEIKAYAELDQSVLLLYIRYSITEYEGLKLLYYNEYRVYLRPYEDVVKNDTINKIQGQVYFGVA